MAAFAARLRSVTPLPKDASAVGANVSPVALLLLVLALGGLGLTVTGTSPDVLDQSIQAPLEPEAALLPRGELPIIGDPIRDLTIWYAQRVSDANRAAVENLKGRFLTPVDPLTDEATSDLYGKMLIITIPLLTLGGLVLGYLIMVARTSGESAYAVRSVTPRFVVGTVLSICGIFGVSVLAQFVIATDLAMVGVSLRPESVGDAEQWPAGVYGGRVRLPAPGDQTRAAALVAASDRRDGRPLETVRGEVHRRAGGDPDDRPPNAVSDDRAR